MNRCPLHGTFTNAAGDCLPCEIVSGQFDLQLTGASPADQEAYKIWAAQRERDAVNAVINDIEKQFE